MDIFCSNYGISKWGRLGGERQTASDVKMKHFPLSFFLVLNPISECQAQLSFLICFQIFSSTFQGALFLSRHLLKAQVHLPCNRTLLVVSYTVFCTFKYADMLNSAMKQQDPTLGEVGATKLWNVLIIPFMTHLLWPVLDDCTLPCRLRSNCGKGIRAQTFSMFT